MRCTVCGVTGNPAESFCRNCGKVFGENEYYIWKQGTTEPQGPVTERDLREKLAARQLSAEDSIARVGEQNWTPIARTHLANHAPTTNPQIYPFQGQPQNFPNQPQHLVQTPNYGGLRPNMTPVYRGGVPEAYARGDYSLGPRFGGIILDSAIAIPLVIMAIIPFIGLIGAPLWCLYMISRDVLMGNGQSIGKKATGTRVVRADGQPITWVDSVRRNIIYFAVLALVIPYFGIFLYSLIAAPLGIVEMILILTGGQRLGDRLSNTYVVKA
jgi:uncharacterized RDD family membrane protein YckC